MDIFKGLHDEFGWFIWGFVGIAFLWFWSGGANNQTAHEGAYIKPLAPLDTGQVYGTYYAGSDGYGKTKLDLPEAPSIFFRDFVTRAESFFIGSTKPKDTSITSILSKKLSFDGSAGAKNSIPGEEYLRIVASEYAQTAVSLAGITLRGTGSDIIFTLPKAVNLLTLGVTALKENVLLPPRGRVIVSSGRSPVGTSFRVNVCTGYLDQFQTYTPAPLKECPSPLDELKRIGPANEIACTAFVETIPRCRIYQGNFPTNISSACKAFVSEKLNYNVCEFDHKTDIGFFKDEWRLFLDQTTELWKQSGEIIRLLDEKGNTIDAVTY